MSYAKRTDANHAQIASAFAACGWYVKDVHTIPNFCDFIVARAGRVEFIEAKDGAKPPSARQLTPGEHEFHAHMAAAGYPVRIITSAAEAAAL